MIWSRSLFPSTFPSGWYPKWLFLWYFPMILQWSEEWGPQKPHDIVGKNLEISTLVLPITKS